MTAGSVPPSSPTAIAPGLRFQPLLGHGALWVLLWFSLLRLPGAPASALDPSWQMTLGYAALHHWQFGTELVFTYGPLGYLFVPINVGASFTGLLAGQFVACTLFATLFFWFGRSLHGWRRPAYYGFVCLLGTQSSDQIPPLLILVLALALLQRRVEARRWLVLAAGAVLGALALVKFTAFLLVVVTVGLVASHRLWRRRWRDAALVLGAPAASFLAGWLLLGQHPAHLPAFVRHGLEISLGYGPAMATYETSATLALGLASAATLFAGYALVGTAQADRARALCGGLAAAAVSFLMWKHGFIRGAGHEVGYFLFCLYVAVIFPALWDDAGRWPRLQTALFGAGGALALGALLRAHPQPVVEALSAWNLRVKASAAALLDLPAWERTSREQFAEQQRFTALPQLRALVRSATVDVLGHEQGVAVFNGLNFRPRPVFQGYSVHTAELLRLNEAAYRSDRAPDFVLQKQQTIDGRLPALDDALATRALYRRYRFVAQEQGFLLWQRGDAPVAPEAPEPVATARLAVGETWMLPDRGDTPLWLELELRPTLLGRLRALLYKPPQVTLRVSDADGFAASFRFIPPQAAAGFLAAPYFPDNDSLVRFAAGAPAARLASVALELADSDRRYFHPAVTARLSALAPFPRPAADSARAELAQRFRMFNRVPISASGMYPPGPMDENGRDVLFAHPPSRIEFQPDADSRHVTGRFGLTDQSHQPPNHTDGADFVLEWAEPSGRVTLLFSRSLRPAEVSSDRGPQSFDLTLPSGPGRLILRTTPGANRDVAFDWAYWTDVVFAK